MARDIVAANLSEQRPPSPQSIRYSISACASVNKCAGHRSELICSPRSDVLWSMVTLLNDLRDTNHQGNHCRAELPSYSSSSGWHLSYNPKVFNAPRNG